MYFQKSLFWAYNGFRKTITPIPGITVYGICGYERIIIAYQYHMGTVIPITHFSTYTAHN